MEVTRFVVHNAKQRFEIILTPRKTTTNATETGNKLKDIRMKFPKNVTFLQATNSNFLCRYKWRVKCFPNPRLYNYRTLFGFEVSFLRFIDRVHNTEINYF